MKAKVVGIVVAVLSTIGVLTARSEAASLTPGLYNVYAQITNEAASQGDKCASGSVPDASEGWFIELFQIAYNGPGKAATATLPVPYVQNNGQAYGPWVALVTLPPTPTGTNTTWNGTYSEVLQPGNVVYSSQTFTATLSVTSTLSFVGLMTFNNFGTGSSPGPNICTFNMQYVAMFAGPAN